MVTRLQYLRFCLFEMYVIVVFVIRCLYSAIKERKKRRKKANMRFKQICPNLTRGYSQTYNYLCRLRFETRKKDKKKRRKKRQENSNSNSKTFFSKDCSLGSFRPV